MAQPRDDGLLGLLLELLRLGDTGEVLLGRGPLLRVLGTGGLIAEPRHLRPARVDQVMQQAQSGRPAIELGSSTLPDRQHDPGRNRVRHRQTPPATLRVVVRPLVREG